MKCPYCESRKTQVTNSRPHDKGLKVRRRRVCEKCTKAFYTIEIVEPPSYLVTKRDGKEEDYSRDRLVQSIRKAIEKKSFTLSQIEQLAIQIEHKAFEGRKSVSSHDLGDLVLAKLRTVDPLAYLRFASVYKKIKTLDDFERELKSLKEG
jgi:transcriptional repressor NrdR